MIFVHNLVCLTFGDFQMLIKKDFSFFSRFHHTYTCINYFLIDNRLIGSADSCQYHTISVSDHVALSFQLSLPLDPLSTGGLTHFY